MKYEVIDGVHVVYDETKGDFQCECATIKDALEYSVSCYNKRTNRENDLKDIIRELKETIEKYKSPMFKELESDLSFMRDDAIKYIMSEKLVQLRECRENCGRGRTPVFISLTEKGSERVMEISRRPRHKSVWEI